MTIWRLGASGEDPPDGLYEDLLSDAIARQLDGLAARKFRVGRDEVSSEEAPEHLVRGIAQALRIALDGITGKEAAERRLGLANDLLRRIVAAAPEEFRDGEGALRSELLRSLQRPNALGETGPEPGRPRTALSRSELFVNAERHGVLQELASEIPSADRIDLVCAFVKWSGFVKVRDALQAHCERRRKLRVLTTTYLGASDARAIEELRALGAEVRISYEETPTRLHAKAWLFHRESGLTTAYIGSSNLSRSALTDGIEWNVRVSASDLPHVVEKFQDVFQTYWEDPGAGFVPFDGGDASRSRLVAALARARLRGGSGRGGGPGGDASVSRLLDVEPQDFQRVILDELDVARSVRGQRRNLVVSATGTGKTVIAALDYRRLRASGIDSLLVVAHREDILRQSRQVFREVLRSATFGELYVGGERPLGGGRHVFASIQSLAGVVRRGPLAADSFDVVIIDEVHHAAARTYRALLDTLRPKELLGLTATPERADDTLGRDECLQIEEYFPRPWAAELRLWDAIDRQILVPFVYLAVDDGTRLDGVPWKRGRYSTSDLSNVLRGDEVWVGRVAKAVLRNVRDPRAMRAIAFCVDKAHARFAAARLREELKGLDVRVEALTSDDSPETRRALLDGLASEVEDRPRILCVVDLLNEGVDIPVLDTVLLLRPTESATLFLQQIGRGLRRAEGKDVLTVIDFVGLQHDRFRFEARYRALLGVTRGELTRGLRSGFSRLPTGCHFHLEEKPRSQILESLRRSLRLDGGDLSELLRGAGREGDTIRGFLMHAEIELEDLYRNKRSWTALRREAGRDTLAIRDDVERDALASLQQLLHVDDAPRLAVLEGLAVTGPQVERDERSARLARMLLAVMYGPELASDLGEALAVLAGHEALRAELRELTGILRGRARVVGAPPRPRLPGEVPLELHARYRTEEISTAFDLRTREGKLYLPQTGVVKVGEKHDALLVTVDKSGKKKFPHLQYNDYAITPELFHWQSQASGRRDRGAGRRHLSADVTPVLFLRETDRDERGLACAYTCLGTASRVEDHGERPITIVWRLLDGPIPAEMLLRTRVAVA